MKMLMVANQVPPLNALLQRLDGRKIYSTEAFDEEDAISILGMKDEYPFEVCAYYSDNGSDFPRLVRNKGITTPLICFSAVPNTVVVDQLSKGCDQVLWVKSQSDEVEAYVRAVVRRCKNVADPVMVFGELVINLATLSVQVGDKPVHVTACEWKMLEALALARGRLVTLNYLYNTIYSDSQESPEQKICDVYICKLNKKLSPSLGYKPIKTVWGKGRYLSDGT